jgi:uncharacterized protein (DUF2237 family)
MNISMVGLAEAGYGEASDHWNIVLHKPLALFSKSPMTGYKRDGYCRTGPDDPGNHTVAGVVTDEFLDVRSPSDV